MSLFPLFPNYTVTTYNNQDKSTVGTMDFYEELGLSRTASQSEIRRSYKCLTLLLHPDQQQNPKVRVLAEGQMKRLNEMVEILTDPERRRIYDESLQERTLAVIQTQPMRWGSWMRNNPGWVLVGLAFVIVLISVLLVPTFDSARSAGKEHEPVAAYRAARGKQERTGLASPQTALTESKQRSIERRISDADWKPAPGLPSPLVNSQLPATSVERPVPQATVALPASTIAPEPRIAAPPQAPPPGPAAAMVLPVQSAPSTPRATPTLAGRWVYTPDSSDPGDPKLYPAEYVELSIVPVGNTLRGAYQSRYKLPNHALNSRVNFTFEGPAAATSFVWRGDSGAQGEITIRLKSIDTLNLNWFATTMGSALSLGSGSATLYRFR
jgi:curved DNA-binding protein CbpA